MPKKLVLAVIDSLKPEQLDRAVAAGEAPVLATLLEDGTYVRDCVSVYPSVTPGGGGGHHHRGGPRRAPDPLDELVPPRRGALRGVRLVVPGDPRPRRLPLALRHRLQHEHGPPLAGGEDGVRAPRRRRAAHRGHHLPDLARPPPPRAQRRVHVPPRGRGGPVPPPRVGPARSSSTPTCSTRRTPAAPPRWACPASATATAAAWARRWSRTTCSTSCSSPCPTTTPSPTATGPAEQVRSIAEADRALAQLMEPGRRARRVPGGPRRDRHVRPLADPGRGAGQPGRRAVAAGGCSPPPTWRPTRPRWRSARPRARRWSTRSTRRSASRPPPTWWRT